MSLRHVEGPALLDAITTGRVRDGLILFHSSTCPVCVAYLQDPKKGDPPFRAYWAVQEGLDIYTVEASTMGFWSHHFPTLAAVPAFAHVEGGRVSRALLYGARAPADLRAFQSLAPSLLQGQDITGEVAEAGAFPSVKGEDLPRLALEEGDAWSPLGTGVSVGEALRVTRQVRDARAALSSISTSIAR